MGMCVLERTLSKVDTLYVCCFVHAVCYDYLGMESGDISDGNIIASSKKIAKANNKNANGYPHEARLKGSSCWRARFDDNNSDGSNYPWIQADIGYQTNVSGVVMQGDGGVGDPDWVETMKVSTFCKCANDTEVYVKDDSGQVKVRTETIKVSSYNSLGK